MSFEPSELEPTIIFQPYHFFLAISSTASILDRTSCCATSLLSQRHAASIPHLCPSLVLYLFSSVRPSTVTIVSSYLLIDCLSCYPTLLTALPCPVLRTNLVPSFVCSPSSLANSTCFSSSVLACSDCCLRAARFCTVNGGCQSCCHRLLVLQQLFSRFCTANSTSPSSSTLS